MLRAIVAAGAAALSLLSVTLPAQPSAVLPYTVVMRDGRKPLAVRASGGQEMFALDDLARLFGLTLKEDPVAGGLTVAVGTQTIALSPQQPLASVSGRLISLPAAPVHDGRTWYVPVDFVSRALAPISPSKIELRKPSRLVLVDVRMPRVAARAESVGAITRVTVDVAPPTPHSVAPQGNQIVVRFDADGLDAADFRANAPTDTLSGMHATDAPPSISLDLGARFATFRAFDQPVAPASPGAAPAATRIVIDLMPQPETLPTGTPTPGASTSGAPATAPPAGGQAPQPPPTEAPPLLDLPPPGGLRTIVVDAGHGGEDLGVRGPQGTLEKNVTLGVARRLKAAIETRLGVRVLLTRDGDQAVTPDQRASLANNNKADLFISLHANASVRPGVAGAQVCYLGLAGFGGDAEPSRGTPEALPVVGGGSREIEIIPWETAQGRYIQQSAVFASAIETALRERLPMSPRTLQQGPFRVLVGANMPAVLIELGFLTNPEQEKALAGDTFQNAAVQAVTDAIVRFHGAPGPGTPGTR